MDKILSYINLISLSLSTATVYNGMAPYANFHCKEILVQDSVIIRVNGTVTLIETDTKKYTMDRVPIRTGKPGKMGRHFPVREKSGDFEQTGKVRENHTKYWKN